MRTCPMLWRQQPAVTPDAHRNEDSRDPARRDPSWLMQPEQPAPECLGAACRFYAADETCGLQGQQEAIAAIARRLSESEERWENVMLSLVELTERLESALQLLDMQLAPPPGETSSTDPRSGRDQSPGTGPPQPQTAVPDPDDRKATAPAQPTDRREAARRHNQEGVQLYRAGEMAEARRRFQWAVQIDPGCVESLNNLGLLEMERGNVEAATHYFQNAITLSPKLPASYTNLGYILYVQEDYAGAIAMYEKAMARGENSSAAWTNLGNAHYKLKNLDAARRSWQQALALDPQNTKAAANLKRLVQATVV